MKIKSWLVACIVLGLCGLFLQPIVQQGFNYIQATRHLPTPNDGLEGTLLYEALLVKHNQALYRPIIPDEFVSAPYTPLHPRILAFLPFNPSDPFSNGRLISIVAYGAIALLLGANVATHTRQRWLGIVAALLWLAFPPAQLWTTRIKPDLLALMFTTGGLYLASLRRGRWADWAAIVFGLAFLTKQTALIAPFAVGLNLLTYDWRRALRYGLIYGLAIGIPYFALDLATGRLATAHIWGLHRSEWWNLALFWKYARLLLPYLVLVGLACLAIKRVRDHFGYRQAMLYALFAPVTLYAAGEIGAHHNHLFETMSAWIVAGTLGAGLILERTDQNKYIASALTLIVSVGLIGQAWLMRQPPEWYRGEYIPLDLARYVTYIQSKPDPVLLDNPGLALSANKAILFDDPSTMGPAINSGVWSPEVLHQKIVKREFSLILLEIDPETTQDPSGRWTAETLTLIQTHYRVEFKDTLFAYVPKDQ